MISKQEYTALREAEAAYYAILYTANVENFSFDVIDTKRLRSLVQDRTGFPFSELAVAKALQAPEALSFAKAVSSHSELGSYKFDIPKTRDFYKFLALREGSDVWQLEHVDHAEFRAKVNAVRKLAASKYDIDKNYANPVVGAWANVNSHMIDGMFQQTLERKRPHRGPIPANLFARGALQPEWLSVYLGAVAIIVAIWIG